MQTLLTDLFPWLVGLYLLDGVAVVRPFERLFVSRWGGDFSVLGPGLHWISIGPSAEVIACSPPPFFVSADAVHLLARGRKEEPVVFAPEDFEAVPFAALGKLERVHRTIASAAIKLKAPTPAVASRWAHHLAKVAQAPSNDRPKIPTSELGEADGEVRELRTRIRPWLGAVQVTSSTMTALIFTVLPLALYAPELKIDLARLLVTLGALDVATVVLGGVALARAKIDSEEIVSTLLMLLLLPVQAMRAPAHLSRQAFLRFDQISLARVLLTQPELATVCRRESHRMAFSAVRTPALVPSFAALADAWRRAVSTAAPTPLRATADAAKYCPICIAQYQAHAPRCSDCGVPLVELEPRVAVPRAATG